jgi:hypothetical protein
MITLYDSGHYLILVSVRYEILRIILYWWYFNYKYNTYMQLLRTDMESNDYRTDWQIELVSSFALFYRWLIARD